MRILQVYVRKQKLTGSPVFTNVDGVPIDSYVMGAVHLLWVDMMDGTIKIIKNDYGPIGIFTKTIFDDEFNVPEITKEELEINY